MLSPRQKRYADRLLELIDAGDRIAELEKPSEVGPRFQGRDTIEVQAWLANVFNIIERAFGRESPQRRLLADLVPDGVEMIEHSDQIQRIVGLLLGALDDLESGYLLDQEFLIAGELFDTLLEQAKHLNRTGYKDPAAVLGRVVLEDALRRMARAEGLDHTKYPSPLNEDLRNAGRYPQPQWRQVQVWLDIGNAAAHGLFGKYTQQQVVAMLDGIEQFLSVELRP